MVDSMSATLTIYFKNKLELYNKVLIDIIALWNETFNQITADDDPGDAIGG